MLEQCKQQQSLSGQTNKHRLTKTRMNRQNTAARNRIEAYSGSIAGLGLGSASTGRLDHPGSAAGQNPSSASVQGGLQSPRRYSPTKQEGALKRGFGSNVALPTLEESGSEQVSNNTHS